MLTLLNKLTTLKSSHYVTKQHFVPDTQRVLTKSFDMKRERTELILEDCSRKWQLNLVSVSRIMISNIRQKSLADPGGDTTGVRPPPPPNRIHFFCFCICFCRKVYTSEVGTPPQWVGTPPMGNPGSATGNGVSRSLSAYIRMGM